MPLQWLTLLSWVALALGAASAIVIALDIARGDRQQMPVMDVVWPVTGWYFGPLAVWAFAAMSDHTRRERSHEARAAVPSDGGQRGCHVEGRAPQPPFWHSVFKSVSHCGAGCTLGDVISEWVVNLTGLVIAGSTLWASYVLDYALAYILGIAFQYFAIVSMRNLSPQEGIKAAIKADTLSLTAFEVGLFGWTALFHFVVFHPALRANDPVYWVMMQIGMILGFATSYPVNIWLVRVGVKERM